ncbi:MAG: DNA polymerase Y family protein [Azonexus sp.]|nr:DNA polymerase Y family protein [Azonexus sp.]
MLWLALHFPLLPIEALPLRQPPSAVVARGRVQVADEAAVAAGVCSGQKLSTALGLQPGLAVFERDAGRERQALESLACWVGRFTPTISLQPPDTLLLEIGGCLRLFGGAEAIIAAVLAGCAEQSYSVRWAAAPTPLGARWLARAGGSIKVDTAGLPAVLAPLPCRVPGWPGEVTNRLESFGLKRLGELYQMPGAGLRRRIGNGPVDDLLRAWGDLPDPQQAFVFPESFAVSIELPARVEHAEALVFAGQRLFAALAGWLHGRQLLVRRCTLQLSHDDGPPTALALNFAEPAADEGRFIRLLREHLGRLQLSAPVEALRLQADELVDKPGESAHLFDQAVAGEGALACLERLRARLGEQAVQALTLVADHRPECATHEHDAVSGFGQNFGATVAFEEQAGQAAVPCRHRPLWLLPVPQALAEQGGSPQWHGPLKLLSRAERLESGWWDEGEDRATGDVRRDYFVARNPQGQRAWVFRNAEGWFLHGLFA